MELEDYRLISARIGLPMQYVIKEFHVFDVLGKINYLLPDYIAFVGGTAINKIYLKDNQRFSEDLDFEVYGTFPKIEKIEGYTIKGKYKYKKNIRIELEYDSPIGKNHVRVDFREKKGNANIVKKTLESKIAGLKIFGINTLTLDDLIARKLFAMYYRSEGKDVYDVINAFNQCTNVKKSLLEVVKNEGMDWNKFIERLKKQLKNLNIKELQRTNPYIPVENRPDWQSLKKRLMLIVNEF